MREKPDTLSKFNGAIFFPDWGNIFYIDHRIGTIFFTSSPSYRGNTFSPYVHIYSMGMQGLREDVPAGRLTCGEYPTQGGTVEMPHRNPSTAEIEQTHRTCASCCKTRWLYRFTLVDPA